MDGQSRLPAIRKRSEGLEGYSLRSNKNGIRPTRVQGGTNFSSPKPRMSLCLRRFVPLRLRDTPWKGNDWKVEFAGFGDLSFVLRQKGGEFAAQLEQGPSQVHAQPCPKTPRGNPVSCHQTGNNILILRTS